MKILNSLRFWWIVRKSYKEYMQRKRGLMAMCAAEMGKQPDYLEFHSWISTYYERRLNAVR